MGFLSCLACSNEDFNSLAEILSNQHKSATGQVVEQQNSVGLYVFPHRLYVFPHRVQLDQILTATKVDKNIQRNKKKYQGQKRIYTDGLSKVETMQDTAEPSI